MSDEPRGIYGKYRVTKADGAPVDPKAQYFVLRLDTDSAARAAARMYAQTIRRNNPTLASDLIRMCDEYDFQVHLSRRNGRTHP